MHPCPLRGRRTGGHRSPPAAATWSACLLPWRRDAVLPSKCEGRVPAPLLGYSRAHDTRTRGKNGASRRRDNARRVPERCPAPTHSSVHEARVPVLPLPARAPPHETGSYDSLYLSGKHLSAHPTRIHLEHCQAGAAIPWNVQTGETTRLVSEQRALHPNRPSTVAVNADAAHHLQPSGPTGNDLKVVLVTRRVQRRLGACEGPSHGADESLVCRGRNILTGDTL